MRKRRFTISEDLKELETKFRRVVCEESFGDCHGMGDGCGNDSGLALNDGWFRGCGSVGGFGSIDGIGYKYENGNFRFEKYEFCSYGRGYGCGYGTVNFKDGV